MRKTEPGPDRRGRVEAFGIRVDDDFFDRHVKHVLNLAGFYVPGPKLGDSDTAAVLQLFPEAVPVSHAGRQFIVSLKPQENGFLHEAAGSG